ncbi:dTDP-4-dehydrorhamnose 3,5-epimerase family protein [Pseudophaeobacter sp.]|uniref:dTDP-4-dehydrorhamnose 3,5-epimerase family protein n=1 Tax=Pseudophaeobacter sp. TaxID=1971739 RepID=UPI0032970C9B
MKFIPLALTGAYEVQLEPRRDARGLFARTYCAAEFAQHRLNTSWPQMNMSVSLGAGTVRGLHFQREPAAEIKLVRCLRGRALDVIVDLRSGSRTYGQHLALELCAETRNAIYIPKGFAHGFQTLEEEVELQYLHSTPYAPGHEGGISPTDPDLAIAWPLAIHQMSERDMALPPLSEVTPL